MEELSDRTANSEVKPDSNKPQPQQQQRQQKQSGESSQQGSKKCNIRPSISEAAESPMSDRSKLDNNERSAPAQ
jgi:hypothetical protein